MTELGGDIEQTVLLHTAGDSLIGRAMVVKVQKTGPDQIDLYCGQGDETAIVCVTITEDGLLMVELTDPSEDDEIKVHMVFKNRQWVQVEINSGSQGHEARHG